MSHISENFFGKRSNQHSIKDGLGGALDNRAGAVNHYKNYKQKLKKELKAIKNKNKILYGIAKKSGSRRELNKIKNIKANASKKCSNSSSKYSSNGSDYDPYPSINID